MDLGASICTPKRPSCLMCPLQRECAAHAQGLESALPARTAKPERPVRVGIAFLALREDGCVLLRRRPEAGLLGGMLEVPSTEWGETLPPVNEALRAAPVRGEWWAVPGTVGHTFTHFRLEMLVYRAHRAGRRHAHLLGRPAALPLGRRAATSTAPRCPP